MVLPPICSEILSSDEVSFDRLLSRMAFSTGKARSYAEKHFQVVASYEPDAVCTKLMSVIRSSTHSDIRMTSLKWLRYVVSHFPCSQSHHWKNALLQLLHREEERTVLEQLRHVVIVLATKFLPDDRWPEIHFSIFPAILHETPRVPASALFLFSHLAGLMKISWFPPADRLQSSVQFYLSKCAEGGVEDDPQNSTLLAVFTLIDLVPVSKTKERESLQSLLDDVLNVLEAAYVCNQQSTAKDAVRRLTRLINAEPKFICGSLCRMVGIMLSIAKSDKAQEDLKLSAVNLVVTLAKTREKEPVMIEQLLVLPYLEQFVAILLEMLSDMEDRSSWYTTDPNKDKNTGEESNFKCARMFSNALSFALGGDLLVPVVTKLLPACLSVSNWKKRHAAFFFLKEIAKACCEAMKENLEQFVDMIIASFDDNHPRVQGAALIALRVLLVDLKPDLEAQHFHTIFSALLQQAIKTSNEPRIQVEAARSAWTFIGCCRKDMMKMYLIDLLDLLIHAIIFTKNRVVEDEGLLILGSLAYLLEDILESDYRNITQWLMTFLGDAICCFDFEFCAKLVNCISSVGTVVGKGHFRNDAKEVMNLISSKCETMEADDPATGYLLQAWMKLLKCLGRDFLPYLNLVMPPLLLSVQSDFDNNTGVKTDKGDGEKLLDQICHICHYADEFKEDGCPLICQVVPLLLPFLKIKFHKKVRKAAISAMSKLLRSTKLAVDKEIPCVAIQQLCAKMITSLTEAMHEEDDKELCCEMVKSLVDCIQLSKS